MKKLTKVAAVLLIFCMCFTAVAFAAGEAPDVEETDEETTEETAEEMAEDAGEAEVPDEGTEVVFPETDEAISGEAEDAGNAVPAEETEETEPAETGEPAGEVILMDLPQAAEGEGISEETAPEGVPIIDLSAMEVPAAPTPGPVWPEADEPDPSPEGLMEDWLSVNDDLGVDGDLVTLDDIPWDNGAYSRSAERTEGTEAGPEALPGLITPKEIPLVVLVVGFSNINYSTGYNWASTIFTASDSLSQYYKDQSGNKFTFVPAAESSAYGSGGNTNSYDKANDGVVHVKISDAHRDWSLDYSSMSTNEMYRTELRAIRAAVLASDPYVNYKSFDANGDGKITTNEMGLAVVMAGYEAAYDRTKPMGANYYLWSHAWSLSAGYSYDSSFTLPTPDGVAVNSFITIPENLDSGTQEPISVLAHELGHYLGLPDLYSTEGSSSNAWYNYQVSAVSVMAGGPWTWNGSKYIPSSFDAWCKCALGWVRPTVVESGTQYSVTSTQGTYNVLLVQTTNVNEYYLVENRQYNGWDAGLKNYSNGAYYSYAPSGGLIFWHIDDAIFDKYDPMNQVNATTHRPGVMPLFPETTTGNTSGTVTFIGKLPSAWVYRPFWSQSLCKSLTGLGNITLPMYNGSDSPSGRKYTTINCKFLSDSGTSINVLFGGTVKAAQVERIAGANRYQTAITGAHWLRNDYSGRSFSNVVIASGSDFADALSGAYLASRKGAPILLVNSSTVNEVASFVKSNMTSSGTIFILGGTAAVPASMETALRNKGFSTSNIRRLYGANRYDTNVEVLKYLQSTGGLSGQNVLVCAGKDYADALSASAVYRPILLTNNSALTPKQQSFLDSYASQINFFYCIGGTGVISNKTAWDIYHYKDPDFDPRVGSSDDPQSASISRVSGVNRYKTSVEVARVFFGTPSNKRIFLAYGLDFPDGLSGGPISRIESSPMILVTNTNRTDAREYATSRGVISCVVMGGKALISDATAYYILGR